MSSPGPNGASSSRYLSLNPGTRASRSSSVREAWYSEPDAEPALFTTEVDATGIDDDGVAIIGDDAPLDVTESSVIVDTSRSSPGRRGATAAAILGDAPTRSRPRARARRRERERSRGEEGPAAPRVLGSQRRRAPRGMSMRASTRPARVERLPTPVSQLARRRGLVRALDRDKSSRERCTSAPAERDNRV